MLVRLERVRFACGTSVCSFAVCDLPRWVNKKACAHRSDSNARLKDGDFCRKRQVIDAPAGEEDVQVTLLNNRK